MKATSYLLAAGVLFAGSWAQATVVVDGTGTGTNYATLQEAIDAVLASPTETEIEIQTDSLTTGAAISEGTSLQRNLTIEAGEGYSPVIAGSLVIMPDNEDTTVTLRNLKISPGVDNTDALVAAGSIRAENCIFEGGTAVSAGILCANTSFGTTGRLELTSCTMTGWYGLVVGRAIQDYDLDQCLLYTAVNGFHHGIANFGNQPINRGSGIGLNTSIPDDGIHAAATTPRTLNLDRCILKAGRPLAWPCTVGGYPETYSDFGDLLGPITATNCVFEGLVGNSIVVLGWYDMPAHTQDSTFTHCTFRNAGLVLDAGSPPTEASGSTINMDMTNCLMDIPNAQSAAIAIYYYAISGYNTGTVNLTGDANAYNVPPFAQNAAFQASENTRIMNVDAAPFPAVPNFETTFYSRICETIEDYVVDTDYHLLPTGEDLAKDKAVAIMPPVMFDFELELRPGGTLNDIGADEVNGTSKVNAWALY